MKHKHSRNIVKWTLIAFCAFLSFVGCRKKETEPNSIINDTFLKIVDTIGYHQKSLIYIPNYIDTTKAQRAILIHPDLLPLDTFGTSLKPFLTKDTVYRDFSINDTDKIEAIDFSNLKNVGKYVVYPMNRYKEIADRNDRIVLLGSIRFSQFYFNAKRDKAIFFIQLKDTIKASILRLITVEKNNEGWVITGNELIETTS
jgi:hypothetical protein